MGSTLATVASTPLNAYSSATITSGVTTRGLISYGVTSTATSPITFQTREGTNKPQLVVVTTPAADTTAPGTPTLSANVRSNTEIDLSWTAATDNVAVAGYRIYRGGTLISTVGSLNAYGGLTWSDTGLTPGTSYSYQVSAVDAAGNEGTKSTAVAKTTTNVAPIDTTAPAAPTNLQVTAMSANRVDLSWTAATDNVGVTAYTISRGGTAIARVAGTATTFTDYTAVSTNTYTYSVTASDAAGLTSVASNSVGATPPLPTDTTKPSPPTNLAANVRSSARSTSPGRRRATTWPSRATASTAMGSS